MLSYEQVGRMFLEIVSGSFIISKWKTVVIFSISECSWCSHFRRIGVTALNMMVLVMCLYFCSSVDTVTVTKVDIIQKQLEALVVCCTLLCMNV